MTYTKHTKERLQNAVDQSTSVLGVLRTLGLKQTGGNHSHISRRIKEFDIDISHFGGQYQGLRSGVNKRSAEHVLILREPTERRERTFLLRRALFEVGVPYLCAFCGQSDVWNDQKLVLEIDHINGKHWDDRQDNLRFLCPNCHSQRNHE